VRLVQKGCKSEALAEILRINNSVRSPNRKVCSGKFYIVYTVHCDTNISVYNVHCDTTISVYTVHCDTTNSVYTVHYDTTISVYTVH